jgi:hypothetical protein
MAGRGGASGKTQRKEGKSSGSDLSDEDREKGRAFANRRAEWPRPWMKMTV